MPLSRRKSIPFFETKQHGKERAPIFLDALNFVLSIGQTSSMNSACISCDIKQNVAQIAMN